MPDDFGLHDLRHTYASVLANRGDDDEVDSSKTAHTQNPADDLSLHDLNYVFMQLLLYL